jgi:O-antigen/teichoic acid export membrane protein
MRSLVKRSIESVSWNIIVSIIQIVVGFVRSLLLARYLEVETFGIYTFAHSLIILSAIIPNFGLGGAFLHRSEETEAEEEAAATHFTLKTIFSIIWIVLLGTGAFIFAEGQNRLALLVLTGTQGGVLLCQTPNLILTRRVIHRRLALLQSINVTLSAFIAVLLAWQGVELWALLSTDIITLIVTVFFLYIWRPVWRPRMMWAPEAIQYYLRYGSRNVAAQILLRALDRVDDLWTGAVLGDTAMGYYSRAYAFATYPRMVLAQSINKVATGTYAEVAEKRKRLSQAFFRTNALLVRSGFYLAGILALIAPELIRILLGTKWLPMLNAFRLMLIFTMLDPIKVTVANLFLAVGKPEEIVRARGVQLIVMVVGLLVMGPRWGIEGVALAVDMMLVVGIAILLYQARKYVNFSIWALFMAPGIGVGAGMVLARAAILLPGILGSPWRTGFVKTGVFTVFYGGILLLLERRQLQKMFDFLKRRILSQNEQGEE